MDSAFTVSTVRICLGSDALDVTTAPFDRLTPDGVSETHGVTAAFDAI